MITDRAPEQNNSNNSRLNSPGKTWKMDVNGPGKSWKTQTKTVVGSDGKPLSVFDRILMLLKDTALD